MSETHSWLAKLIQFTQPSVTSHTINVSGIVHFDPLSIVCKFQRLFKRVWQFTCTPSDGYLHNYPSGYHANHHVMHINDTQTYNRCNRLFLLHTSSVTYPVYYIKIRTVSYTKFGFVSHFLTKTSFHVLYISLRFQGKIEFIKFYFLFLCLSNNNRALYYIFVENKIWTCS